MTNTTTLHNDTPSNAARRIRARILRSGLDQPFDVERERGIDDALAAMDAAIERAERAPVIDSVGMTLIFGDGSVDLHVNRDDVQNVIDAELIAERHGARAFRLNLADGTVERFIRVAGSWERISRAVAS